MTSKSRHYINQNSLNLLCHALVCLYPICSNLIRGYTHKKIIQRLMNVQKKLIRLIAFKPYTEHTKPIFRQLEILNIEQIYKIIF